MRSLPCLETLETNDTLIRHHIPGEQISKDTNFLVHQIWGSHGTVLRYHLLGERETLCSLVDMHNYFGGTCCLLHLRQGISFPSNSLCC